MRERINNFITYIQGAFDTHSKSASARKLSAFWMVMLVSVLEVTYVIRTINNGGELSYITHMIDADLLFIGSLLGMTTVEKFKKGKDENPTA